MLCNHNLAHHVYFKHLFQIFQYISIIRAEILLRYSKKFPARRIKGKEMETYQRGNVDVQQRKQVTNIVRIS